MEDATILEVDTSSVEPVATDTNVATNTVADTNVGEPTVVEQPTPMDNNVTYDNVPKIEIDPNKDLTQNVIQNAITVEHNNNVSMNAGSAMDNFLNNEYDYDKNEAGTYWVAGAINDVNTQMSFLNAIINEEMYDEMDLQKYYYDTTMATARAYAASKEKETAYGFYRAAQEKAIAEASLTGWYMPAEGQYMLGQYTVAQNVLEDPNADDESRNKATRISNTVQKWFNANQISTRGIKCLTMMNYEENVRHNTIMGELQKEANKIAAQGATASGAAADLQLREFKFQVEELELAQGFNYSKDIGLDNNDYLGHDISTDPDYIKYQALGGAKNLETLLKNPNYFAAVLGARNTEWIKQSLGEENYEKLYTDYQADLGNKGLAESIKNNGNVLDESYLNKETYHVSTKDEKYGKNKDTTIYSFTSSENGKSVTRYYIKEDSGAMKQITESDIALREGGFLSDKAKSFTSSALTKDDNTIRVGKLLNLTTLDGSVSKNKDAFSAMGDKQKKTVINKEKEGWHVKQGYYSTQGIDASIVMENNEGELIEISNVFGKEKKINKDQIKKYSYDSIINSDDRVYNTLMDIGTMEYKDNKDAKIKVGFDSKGNPHYYVYSHYFANDIGTNHYVYDEIQPKDLPDSINIDKLTGNLNAYIEGNPDLVAGKNSNTIAAEQKEKNDREGTVDLTISGISGSTGSSGYEAQDTVEKKNINYDRFESVKDDKENPEFLNGLGSYEEIRNRKNINQIKS